MLMAEKVFTRVLSKVQRRLQTFSTLQNILELIYEPMKIVYFQSVANQIWSFLHIQHF